MSNLSRSERVQQYAKEKTIELVKENQVEREGVDALNCALDLKLDRANVSKTLNTLWKSGHLIKIQGKPVYYLDYDVLTSCYPQCYLPSVISKEEKLSKYLKTRQDQITDPIIPGSYEDPFDSLIGADSSLSDILLNARSAIAYPPYGLHTLISGNQGVGKSHLALKMYQYACVKKARGDHEIPFMTLFCRNYQNNPELFRYALQGMPKKAIGKTVIGALEKCENGIILLEQIENLSSAEQELLNTIISQKKYTHAADNSISELKVMFIATTEKDPLDPSIRAISQCMPISLHLLDIDQRGIYEKMELIMDLFAQEAISIKVPIHVTKDVLVCFASMKYKNNIAQMRNEIKATCSKAYLEVTSAQFKTLYISYNCLSQEMLAQNSEKSTANTTIISLLSCIPNDYVLFNADGTSTGATIFKTAPSVFNNLRITQFVKEFDVDAGDLDNLEDYVSENISCLKNCPDAQLQALRKNINPYVYQVVLSKIQERPKYSLLKTNSQLLYGILLHITNFLKRIEHVDKDKIERDQRKSVTEKIYPDEYMFAKDIYGVFETTYNFISSEREIDFLASYLAIVNQWANKTNVAILVICNGDSIATQMVDQIRHTTEGRYFIDALDFKSSMQLNDLLELACMKTTELNQGAGVLIACDMEPLTTVSDYVLKKTGIPTRTVVGISMPLLIQIVQKSMSPINDIDTLTMQLKSDNTNTSIQKKQSDFITNITNKIIARTVSFIDLNKAIDVLQVCLNNTLKELSIPYSDAIAVKYLCHCTNMLERVIRNEPWDYLHINSFSNKNYYMMHVVEHNLEYVNDTFGIKIPSTELAYIAEIFIDLQQQVRKER